MDTSRVAILMSGGMDSVCLAYWKRPAVGITIDYGQIPAKAEIKASASICKRINIKHYVIPIDASCLGSGDLSGTPALTIAPESDWWPYRNQFLITVAAMKAIQFGIAELMIGTVRSDTYHVDGSIGFIEKISELIQMQEGEMKLTAPAVNLSTLELIVESQIPRGLLGWSHSCHKSNFPCGRCRGCYKHLEVLYELNNPHV
ncbi:7-cyano-7-deazaguanine synthase [Coraliomargarita sp. SDUM461004]|uniref:7-cyano-7-deazaguanine synthase n=1 Tax=Thalassobacterium sedimentorum TaxID=3041258 RepID=A0ABU1AM03_9BACT|nr:7-cyano-7-deazaguanine synthase [Coraliomargarita sp. SDUM461004]MDQ8195243.1 7-cyano-7-deazaguanine synthase [Coraliomargarita sp. SDUM461004]